MNHPTKVSKGLPVAGIAAAAMGLALIVSPTAAADAHLVGPGCAGYAQQVPNGPGSVGELAKVPVATATANSPVLTTLASALSGGLNPQVNLVNTLNGGQFTVFAPTNDAFAKLDAATLDKLKTEFLSLASHQLRSPLTAIKGYTSMLLDGSFGNVNDQQKEAIDRVFQSTNHLTKVVEDLLNVTKIGSGIQYLNPLNGAVSSSSATGMTMKL